MALTGEQYEALSKALLSAFPSRDDLQMMVRFKLGKNLNAIADSGALEYVVFTLIEKAEAQGWAGQLIAGARNANPGNPELAAFSVQYGVSSISPASENALELMVKEESPFRDFKDWLAAWARLEPQVCRIEFPLAGGTGGECGNGLVCGTGFLVSKDLLLTAYHVVEPLINWQERKAVGKKWARPEDVHLRFDYAKREGEPAIHQGTLFSLSEVWDVVHSPYSQADLTTGKIPEPQELDFALIRAASTPGEQPIGGKDGPGAVKRGWIEISAQPALLVADTTIFIMQHPHGRPLKIAYDRIIGLNENNTRVRYRTNTLKGSSGSPCFSATLEPVALHHSGDPAYSWKHPADYNQGIPLAAIAPKILPYLST